MIGTCDLQICVARLAMGTCLLKYRRRLICAVILGIGIFFFTVVLGPIVQIPTAEERAAAKAAGL